MVAAFGWDAQFAYEDAKGRNGDRADASMPSDLAQCLAAMIGVTLHSPIAYPPHRRRERERERERDRYIYIYTY